MRDVSLVVLHHSASDHPDHDNIITIRKWHKERGFDREGYNYFIRKDGTIEVGRPLHHIPAHAKGHNQNSIGICLSGLEEFHVEQFESAAELIYDLKKIFGKLKVKGHKELAKTKCPAYSVRLIKELICLKEVRKV